MPKLRKIELCFSFLKIFSEREIYLFLVSELKEKNKERREESSV